MRPLKLSLTGFRSYPIDTTVSVDFTDKGVVAALGDTGAGKSSLLEAITYALFRKSTWGRPRTLIADNAEQMTVTFEFLHEGHRWRVSRTMHASNDNLGRHHLINLETKKETDGATPVDARIRAVLQMGYETFQRVGLLPQGKFDQLLTETSRDRTARLRELFGTDSLDSVQQMASSRRSELVELLGVAEAKRSPMHDNPTQVAADKGAAAAAADARAERLNTAIDTITGLHKTIATATAGRAATTDTAQNLDQRSVPDATTKLDKIESINADIATGAATLQQRADLAESREETLASELADIEGSGESRDALTKAAAIVERLATRAADHRDERDRLAALTDELDVERASISTAAAEVDQRREDGRPLADAARAASNVTTDLRERAAVVGTRALHAASLARQSGRADGAHRAAVAALAQALDAVEAPEKAVSTALTNSDEALTRLEAAQLRDRGAAIAEELRPGQDCPVCDQLIPAEFAPATTECAEELREAKRLVRTAKSAHEQANSALAGALAAVTAAKNTVAERDRQLRAAQHEAQMSADAVHEDLADFATRADVVGVAFDHGVASVTLNAATESLASQTGKTASDPDILVKPLVAALAACVAAAAARSEQTQTRAATHHAAVNADTESLSARQHALQQRIDDTELAQQRHARALRGTVADTRSLPGSIQTLLAPEVVDISAGSVATASAAIDASLNKIQILARQIDGARAERATVQKLHHDLENECRTRVEEPLAELRRQLNALATSAETANAHLDPDDRQVVPRLPADPQISQIRKFATELETLTIDLGNVLTAGANAYTTELDTATTHLRAQAAALADIDGFDPDRDLANAAILHPLVASAATAANEAERSRVDQQAAQDQIKPKADLDYAIEAGLLRLEAYDVLRKELVDAKFLGHLTELNTTALLGVASELLGRMTDKRFGFAANFDIVSRNGAEVVHSANRLSGGEKFLASLALALALAELHSYNGPRLGALFLDEGFAALDTAALESALEVLRTQTDGNRLVMVISHLHAVAEAVDEVLWVERGATGSSARWLTPSEREKLIRADLASGLQDLA